MVDPETTAAKRSRVIHAQCTTAVMLPLLCGLIVRGVGLEWDM